MIRSVPNQHHSNSPQGDSHFKVNLRAMIDLLSNHLYSGPQVFIRELLQNAVDAIRARQHLEPGWRGEITLEVVPGLEDRVPTLVIEDNGIGLTLDEVHNFLATIGSSSKRDELQECREDYIGQFGIGLLSCFIVTEEIVVITRSARAGQPSIEWRGKGDGSYSIRILETEISSGTKVFLRCRPERAQFFAASYVCDMAGHYGSLLPIPITFVVGDQKTQINATRPPWQQPSATETDTREAYLQYGNGWRP